MRIEKDKAYLLHTTAYRDRSRLAYILTQQQGKVSFIVSAKSSSKPSRLSKLNILQPCRPIQLSYQLKNGLSKITEMELPAITKLPDIQYFMLYQYIHELLLKLLPQQLPDDKLFIDYEYFLSILTQGCPHFALRYMELAIIDFFDSVSGLYQDERLRNSTTDKPVYSLNKNTGISDYQAGTAQVSGQQLSAFNHIVTLYEHQLADNNNNLPHVMATDIRETLAREAQPISTFFIARLLGEKTLKTRNIYRELHKMQLL